jgi:hypothetical protein
MDVLVGSAAGEDALGGFALRSPPMELAEALALAVAELTDDEDGLTAQDLFLLRTSFFPSRLNPAAPVIESESLGGSPKCALG